MVGVVLGVSRLASTGGPMGDGGLAAWRHSCCGPSWSSVCPLVGAGCGGSSVASLAAAVVLRRGGGARAARGLSPGAGCRPGPLWGGGLFCFYLVKYMYGTFM